MDTKSNKRKIFYCLSDCTGHCRKQLEFQKINALTSANGCNVTTFISAWKATTAVTFVFHKIVRIQSSEPSRSPTFQVLFAKTAKAEGPNPERFGLLLVGCWIFSGPCAIRSFSMWLAEARKFFKPNLVVGPVDTIGTAFRSTWRQKFAVRNLKGFTIWITDFVPVKEGVESCVFVFVPPVVTVRALRASALVSLLAKACSCNPRTQRR